MPTYSSGETYRTNEGWFARWNLSEPVEGPFGTEGEAAMVFLDYDPDEFGVETERELAWSGSPCPVDPDNYWIDDDTFERVSVASGERTRAIATSYNNPPIPDRSMDWSAVWSDTYDCDCDQDGFFSLGPVGHGRTEAEAVADLLEQLAERT